ncbi:hypothetical protein BHU72_06780 [Desulfuribacillus stibiiarsenatis]|uniref:RDD domain-containing protein n=1 Tax=Desulfuribacillus stibiiarsenatis TaxID=1390249 RepID=A0A1E5L4B9_9FIRM|nr:RDD family protein [Desulfuribacillus stibiiarsenatis]OEH84893.1 hypothetical protein BHU72_06780 [Desulfuribacillus stibiiarsenatis]
MEDKIRKEVEGRVEDRKDEQLDKSSDENLDAGSDDQSEGYRYGKMYHRGAAYLLDLVLVGVVAMVVNAGLFLVTGKPIVAEELYSLGTSYDETTSFEAIFLLLNALYFVLMPTTSFQATFGKHLFGMKIIDLQGEPLTLGRSLGRYVGTMLSALIFYIGFLMIGLTKNKRGLHDMLAKTYVVYRK